MRWLVMVGGTVGVFCLGLAVCWADPLGVLPEDAGNRLGVATAASGAASAAVAVPLAWWAGREAPPPATGRRVRQRATARGRAKLAQTAGPAADVDQRATARGHARLHQSGADQGADQDPGTPGTGA
ncbi:hypothetical protein [Streptomyces sp. NPDC049881]|uniref:hypothetical protein n=1 Tax=Streptomyces sp. NPDC049881 TaxID=3155778 RepID=UPI00342C6724